MSMNKCQPRTQREIDNQLLEMSAGDFDVLIAAWREFMAARDVAELSKRGWLSGMHDGARFNENKTSNLPGYTWRAMKLGYWIGVAAAKASKVAAQ